MRTPFLACIIIPIVIWANLTRADEHANVLDPAVEMPDCGDIYSPPFAEIQHVGPRKCPKKTARNYVPRHKGIGFDILVSESEACFVPDQVFELLDEVIDNVSKSVQYDPTVKDPKIKLRQAQIVSQQISEELKSRGFGLHIPTDSLGDALINRNMGGQPERHSFDCDTGSLIFLTIVENLGAPVSLVDITLTSGSGHNYVQWKLDEQGTVMNWDTNQQGECVTPAGLPSYEGRGMTANEVKGYALSLRAKVWEREGHYDVALADLRTAMKLYTDNPMAYNNFAWLVATKKFPNRESVKSEALSNAMHAVSINRTANYLDTLACVQALHGDFAQAVATETEAIKIQSNAVYESRLSKFKIRGDCTGEE